MIKKLIFFSLIIVLASCQSRPRVPPLVNHDPEVPWLNVHLVKNILKSTKNEIKKANHVVLVYEITTNFQDIGSKKFRATVYDADHKRQYYLKNDSGFYYSIEKVPNQRRFKYLNYMLNHYLNGKLQVLKASQCGVSDAAFMITFYDIDFKARKTLVYRVDNVVFDGKGNPVPPDYFRKEPFDPSDMVKENEFIFN